MAKTYTLKPTQLDCEPGEGNRTNIVVRVHWAYTVVDGDKSAGMGGTTELAYDPQQDHFIDYVDLTEEEIVDWVLTAWSKSTLQAHKSIVDNQLLATSQTLPWTASEVLENPAP